jgi:sugar-specific transcriptional regulator TrmB
MFNKETALGREMQSSTPSWQKLSEHAALSEYEAKVYVSLVTKGAAKARTLSMTCGVPRTKIYGTLKKLIERGLAVELPGEPRRYAPLSPAKTFKAYLESLRKKANDLSLVISSLEDAYERTKETTKSQKEDIWILEGRNEIWQRVREMLSQAKKFVNIVTTENGLILLYKEANKMLDKLEERGVKVRIETPIGSHNGNLAHELNYIFEVKHTNLELPILFLCVDNREFLLAESNSNYSSADSDEDVGVFSNNPVLYDLISLLLNKHVKRYLVPAMQ